MKKKYVFILLAFLALQSCREVYLEQELEKSSEFAVSQPTAQIADENIPPDNIPAKK